MSKVLVFCEYVNDKLKNGSLELLSATQSTTAEVCAVLVGSGASSVKNIPAQYGAQTVYTCESSDLDNYNSESFVKVLEEAVTKFDADTILASSTLLARDLFPRLAAKLDAGIATDCTELDLSNGLSVKKPLYAGKCTTSVHFSLESKKIILMRPNQLPIADANSSASANMESLTAPSGDLKTLLKEIVKGTSEKLDLTEANVIVSGGRGLKDADNFNKILEPLAEVLGATVGASRAVVDAGWVPHNMQVGQTGKTVAPTLYIACGISGAIQHLAGMTDSKIIVAINSDPEAPIFKKATYGIVGDAFEVVPQLTEEFKALLS